MSGVDGVVKLNSFRAPSTLEPETETTVSAFVVQEQIVKEVAEVIEEPIEEMIEEVDEETFNPINIQSEVVIDKPKKKNKVDIKTLFLAVESVVQKMYKEVFFKTPNFKPAFETTMGDIILYLSKKLSLKNADREFNAHFGLIDKVVAEKYSKGYIPYALKLSKWCADNNKINVCDELLFAISTVYLESAKLSGVNITELELAGDFASEISYAL